jgi:subtilase family serine protease
MGQSTKDHATYGDRTVCEDFPEAMTRVSIWQRLRPLLFCLFLTSLTYAQTAGYQPLPHSASLLAAQAPLLGAAPQDARLDHMLLLLQPSPAQSTALKAFLGKVNNSASPQFHHWLTPVEFGQQFGPSSDTMDALTTWLTGQGLTVDAVAQGRQWIEISGTVANVEQTFQTRINSYRIGAVTRYANATPLEVPAGFASAMQGLVSISGVVADTLATVPQSSTTAITPAQLVSAYNLAPLYAKGINGEGETIAIAARGDVDRTSLAVFRAAHTLPALALTTVLNGADPGTLSSAATLAAAWAGAIAPKATINVIVSPSTVSTDGIDLSAADAVDHDLAPILLVDAAACESALTPLHAAFYTSLFAQASAEGITVIVPTGNAGANCSASGTGVNAIAATPYNVAVGGSELTSAGTESAWNESGLAGSGGASTVVAAPSWQVAAGVPAAGPDRATIRHRYLPDIALAASNLAACSGTTGNSAQSGTAASAAIFAGIMALVDQSNAGPEGNAAPVLYTLAQRQQGVFHDIVTGSTTLNGSGYTATPGYDLATGLGSLDASAFVQHYASAQATGTQQSVVTLSPSYQNVSPGAQVTVSATVAPATGSGPVPTGTVTFYDNFTGSSVQVGTTQQLSSGQLSATLGTLAAGSHSITGAYSGDSNYTTDTSSPVTVLSTKFSTSLSVSSSTLSPAIGSTITATATIQSSQTIAPTGSLSFVLDGAVAGTAAINGSGPSYTATLQIPITSSGSHTLAASYNGDNNYSSATSNPITLTTGKGSTITTLSALPATYTAGSPETFTAVISAASPTAGTSASFTGNVIFYDGTTPLGGAVAITNNQAVLSKVTLDSTSKSHTITAVYSGDDNWLTSTSAPLVLTVPSASSAVTLTSSASVALAGTPVTLTASVNEVASSSAATTTAAPTGTVVFYDGTNILGSATLTVSQGLSTAQLVTTNLAGGNHSLTAAYLGDTNYSAATSSPVTVTVQSYSVTPSATSLTLAPGQSGSITYTVAASGGLDSAVQFACNAPLNTGTTCTFAPATVSGAGTTTLTITTTASSTTSSNSRSPFPRKGAGVFLGMLLCLAPLGWRGNRRLRARALSLVLLVGLGLAGVGCSTTQVSSSLPSQNPATPAGSLQFTITTAVTSGSQTTTQKSYITVNVT